MEGTGCLLRKLILSCSKDETVEDFVKTMLTPWNVERSTSSERDEEKKRLCAREREKEMKEKLQREMKRYVMMDQLLWQNRK